MTFTIFNTRKLQSHTFKEIPSGSLFTDSSDYPRKGGLYMKLSDTNTAGKKINGGYLLFPEGILVATEPNHNGLYFILDANIEILY